MSYFHDQMKKFKINGIVPKTCPSVPLYKLATCRHIQDLAAREEIEKANQFLDVKMTIIKQFNACLEKEVGRENAEKCRQEALRKEKIHAIADLPFSLIE